MVATLGKNEHSGSECDTVSVILPTFNSERFIRQTLMSVLDQEWRDLNVIVVDDASTDSTWEILCEVAAADSRIVCTRLPSNQGAAAARNAALSKAAGRYVAFIDADDLWDRTKLEEQVRFMRDFEAAFTFTSFRLIDESGALLGKTVDERAPSALGYSDMLKKRATLGCSTVVIDQTITGRLEMPNIRTGQDYALWLSILKRGIPARCYPRVLTSYRIVSGSISRNKVKKAMRQWEIYRRIEGLDIFSSVWCFLHYAWRAVIR